MRSLLCILFVCSPGWAVVAEPLSIEEIKARRGALETRLEQVAGRELACFPNQRTRSVLFLPHQRFDAGGDSLLERRCRQFAGHIAQLAPSAVAVGDPTLAYQLLSEAAFFGDLNAGQIVGAGAKPPIAKLARSEHRRLGWKRHEYYRVSSDHFQVVARNKDDGIQVASRLEALYAAWAQLFFECWSDAGRLSASIERGKALVPRTKRLHRVVVFANRAAYADHLRAKQPLIDITLGFYDVDSRTSYFFAGPDSSQATQLHEVTHQLFQEVQSVPARLRLNQNFWAVEGVALYMESLLVDEGVATIGGFYADRLQFARYRRLVEGFYVPLSELVALGRDRLQSDERIRRIYSQSAGLTHFFMHAGDRTFRSGFIDYLRAIYQNRGRHQTLSNILERDLDELDAEYKDFLNVTDADLVSDVIPKNSIRSLCLGQTDTSDIGTRALTDQQHLDWLDLSGTRVSDAGLQFLVSSSALRQVNLAGSRVTDGAMLLLGNQQQLEELDVSNTAVTDAGVQALSDLRSLQILWLSDTSISDSSVPILGKLKTLQSVSLDGTRITDRGRDELRRISRDLRIE